MKFVSRNTTPCPSKRAPGEEAVRELRTGHGIGAIARILLTALVAGLLCAMFAFPASAQQTDIDLANQYFSTQEYGKAAVYYEKQYRRDPFGTYKPYLRCLELLKDIDAAEKLVKKQMKKNPDDLSLYVDLGKLYRADNPEKAKQQFEKAVKELPADVNRIIQLGNAFQQAQETDMALQTYLTGRRLMQGQYPFGFEIAELYAQRGEPQKMIDEYLDLLASNEQFYPNLQAIFQNKIANDLTGSTADLLRVSLLKRIQRYKNILVYNDMLYWLFIQERDFESAFIQARAMDKRLEEKGARMISLGRMCVTNGDFATAEKCFRYVTTLGADGPNYIPARIELVNAANYRLTHGRKPTRAELDQLESEYASALTELGRSPVTAELISGYAHLKAFYLEKIDEAIALLEEAIAMGGVSDLFRAGCKLELGDIYIFKDDVWEAALLYGQVDKDFKHDPIGREAKYRNARLSYYLGEFDWAAAQLNVLKAATSQLISNDALALALLIMDNTGLDSITDPLLVYSRAELLAFRNKDSAAQATLDSILVEYPGHSLTDEVWYKKALLFVKQGLPDSAATYLQRVVERYPEDILADDALYTVAGLYEDTFGDRNKAMELYEKLLTDYPGSLFVIDARRKFRALRGDTVN